MDLIRTIEEQQKKEGAGAFHVGDTVKVFYKIIEGKTERIQIYEGLVLCFKNSGIRKTFTVRKESYGVGVERVFPVYSPNIVKIEISRPGIVRRSKLYYIREKIGKSSKIKERLGGKIVAEVAAANARAEASAASTEAQIKAESVAANAAAVAENKGKKK